jgi:hypothetical protein
MIIKIVTLTHREREGEGEREREREREKLKCWKTTTPFLLLDSSSQETLQ